MTMLPHLHMRSGDDDGGSDDDEGISFDVLEFVCCCLLMLCETKTKNTITIRFTKRTKSLTAVKWLD